MEVDTLRKFVAMEELSDMAQTLLPSEYIIMLRRTLTGRQFAVSKLLRIGCVSVASHMVESQASGAYCCLLYLL
jgi:hypothetical protein